MGMSGAVVSAFTEEQAERLTGVTKRQMRYWSSQGFFVPSVDLASAGIKTRLYGFRDLVCLKVLNALRNEAKVPLGELKRVKLRLAHLGDDVWAKTTLYVLGKRVVFDDGPAGVREEVTSGQRVLQIPLRVLIGDIDRGISALRGRSEETYGRIERKRHVAQNQAVIAGTRIPVRAIKEFHAAGYTPQQIREQYPTLALRDVMAAIAYDEVA